MIGFLSVFSQKGYQPSAMFPYSQPPVSSLSVGWNMKRNWLFILSTCAAMLTPISAGRTVSSTDMDALRQELEEDFRSHPKAIEWFKKERGLTMRAAEETSLTSETYSDLACRTLTPVMNSCAARWDGIRQQCTSALTTFTGFDDWPGKCPSTPDGINKTNADTSDQALVNARTTQTIFRASMSRHSVPTNSGHRPLNGCAME